MATETTGTVPVQSNGNSATPTSPTSQDPIPTGLLGDPTASAIHDAFLIGWSLIELKSRIHAEVLKIAAATKVRQTQQGTLPTPNNSNMVRALVKQYAAKRQALKDIANDESRPLEERFEARLKLAELPRNSSPTRVRNRCSVTGRPRAFYRKLKMSRIALRDLASNGQVPGMTKSSW